MIDIHDTPAIEQFCRQRQVNPHRLQRFRNRIYKHFGDPSVALKCLTNDEADLVSHNVWLEQLQLVDRHDSQLDGASKLLFRTQSGALIESVILRVSSGRTALCISSQSGCAVRCAFCATGQMGTVQNLTYSEIADQVVQAGRLLHAEGRTVRNVVFMGMGEPFHNEENVNRAAELLCSPKAFNLSPRHVCVSTVGIPAAMIRFAERFPLVSLALSLHSVRDDVRARLIPVARRYPLPELRQALQRVTALQCRPLMIEYLLLAGVNDSDDDAAAVADYLSGLPVHVNLIPYNKVAGVSDLTASDAERRWAFARVLRSLGYKVTMRYSLGADIEAACGQLVRGKSSALAGAIR